MTWIQRLPECAVGSSLVSRADYRRKHTVHVLVTVYNISDLEGGRYGVVTTRALPELGPNSGI